MAYILLDIIDMKDLWKINRTKAIQDCNTFWKTCKTRALYHNHGWKFVTFSDSVLISCGRDISQLSINKVREEYNWFRNNLPSDMDFYLIVNHGIEIEASMEHEMIAVETDFGGCKPNYMLIAGLGSCFADLFYADNEIKKRRNNGTLNENLRIYVNKTILEENVPDPSPDELLEVSGLTGKVVFYGFPNLNGF